MTGKEFTRQRKIAGYNQRDMAKELGVNFNTLCKHEHSERVPKLYELSLGYLLTKHAARALVLAVGSRRKTQLRVF